MDKAYLIPRNSANGDERPESLATDLVPAQRGVDVRSIFVTPEPGAVLAKGKEQHIEGLAFDGGDGIVKVEISNDRVKPGSRYAIPRLRKILMAPLEIRLHTGEGRRRYALGKSHEQFGRDPALASMEQSGYMRNEIESTALKSDS
jgi:hypothetical protein